MSLSERKIIDIIHSIIKQYWGEPTYDDSVFYKLSTGDYLVLHTNVANKSTDFIEGMDYYSFGWKITIANLSDIAVKGAKPLGVLFSFSLTEEITENEIKEIVKGICDACNENFAIYLGGDVSKSNELSLAGFSFGITKRIVQRKGIKENDLIGVTGQFGLTSIGYKILFDKIDTEKEIKDTVINALFRPKGRIKEALAISPFINSCMDISDGLALSLHQLCSINNVGADIEEIPIHNLVYKFCEKHNLDPLEISLYEGGEEFEILFTFNEKNLESIRKILENYRCPFTVIGKVKSKKEIILKKLNKEIEPRGWEHFKYWIKK